MQVTYFPHAKDSAPLTTEATTWDAWVAQVQTVGHIVAKRPTPCPDDWEQTAKTSTLCYSPAELRPGANREDSATVAIHFGVVDLDDINPLELEIVERNIQTQGWAALIYTTWKHGTGPGPRVRVVLPFSHPIPADQTWPGLYARLGALVGCGAKFDSTCKNLSRVYFWPSCPDDRASQAWIRSYPGRPLTRDEILAVPAETVTKAVTLLAGTRRVTRPELEAVRDKLKRSTTPQRRAAGFALAAVLEGSPWAVEGERDSLLHSLCVVLASEFPDLDPEYLATAHFPASCAVMGADFPESLVASKLANARRYVAEQSLAREAEALRDHEVRIFAATLGARTKPYTDADLAAFCAAEGVEPDQFARRWILREGDNVFFYVADRGYIGPFGRGSGTEAAHQYLAAAEAWIDLEEPTDKGMRKRSIMEIAQDYGTVLEAVEIDLTADRATYQAERLALVEAPCPLRKLTPEFHPGVDAWLRSLGGIKYDNTLAPWIAWVTYLDKPCAALFLEGEISAGKSMLVEGLSRLWTINGPTKAIAALSSFNGAICDCPLIFADEKMPRSFDGSGKTAEIRDMIGSTSHQIERKYRPSTRAKGAIRLIVAANNRNILSGEKDLSDDDVKAIQKRFLYVRVNPDTSAMLREFDTYGQAWVDGDVIAKHALWLRDQIPLPAQPPRFLIEQSGDNVLSQTMATASHSGGLVANWIVRYLLDPTRLATMAKDVSGFVRVENGELLVASRAVAEGWHPYFTDRPPSANSIGGALRALSSGARDVMVPGKDWRQRMRIIDLGVIVAWAEDRGYASAEQIRGAVAALSRANDSQTTRATN